MVAIDDLFNLVGEIHDNDVKNFVYSMLHVVSESSWSKKASRNHHMVDERGDYGNLLHTIRVTKMVIALCDITNKSDNDSDLLLASAILHDCCRYGLNGSWAYTLREHPALVRKLANANNITCSKSEYIFDIIESHMGKWGNPAYVPIVDNKSLLHVADCALARMDVIL